MYGVHLRGAHLRSDVFYSFRFWPSSRQHSAFEMYVYGDLFACLFIDFARKLIWNVLVNQKWFLYINNVNNYEISKGTTLSFLLIKYYLPSKIIWIHNENGLLFVWTEKQVKFSVMFPSAIHSDDTSLLQQKELDRRKCPRNKEGFVLDRANG